MEKLRLDYFLSLGLKLTEGDVYSIGGDTVTCDSKHLDAQNEVCASNKHRLITSFAWRSDFNNGYLNHPNKLIDVKRGVLNYAISHWRYNINELIKMQNEHDKKEALKLASERLRNAALCTGAEFKRLGDALKVSTISENFPHGILREQTNNIKYSEKPSDFIKNSVDRAVKMLKNKPQVEEKCRVEYMSQDTSSLTIAEFTLKFETKKEYCGLDKKGYCFCVAKSDFIAWHPIDERSELDIAKEKQIIDVLNAVNHSEYLVYRESVRLIQDQGMLAEILSPMEK